MIDTNQLRVVDLMTIEPVVVIRDAPIEAAERLMHDFRIHGLPVVDQRGTLVGVVSQTGLLVRTATLDSPPPLDSKGPRRVEDIMSSPSITIPSTASILEAARVMADQRLHRLVVVDEEDRPTGVISAMDFVHLVAETATGQPDGSAAS